MKKQHHGKISRKILITVVAAAMLLAIACPGLCAGAAYSSGAESLAGLSVRSTEPPEESAESEESAERVESFEGFEDMDQHVEADITLETGESLLSLLQSAAGQDFSWIETIDLFLQMDVRNTNAAGSLALALNDYVLITLVGMWDMREDMVYLQVPEISEDYIGLTLEELLEYVPADSSGSAESVHSLIGSMAAASNGSVLDAELLSEVFQRYSRMFSEKVSYEDAGREILTAGGVSAEYSVGTATLTENEVREILVDISAAMQQDEDLAQILAQLDRITHKDVSGEFMSMLEEIQSIPESEDSEETMTIVSYTDDEDAVYGVSIEIDDEVFFRYAAPANGEDCGLEISFSEGDETVVLSGSGVKQGDRLTGSYTLALVTDESDAAEMGFESGNIDLMYIGVEELSVGEGAEPSGEITLAPTEFLLMNMFDDSALYSIFQDASLIVSLAPEGQPGDMAFSVMTGDELFLRVRIRSLTEEGAVIPAVESFVSPGTWAENAATGGVAKFLASLYDSDIPEEFLDSLFSETLSGVLS